MELDRALVEAFKYGMLRHLAMARERGTRRARSMSEITPLGSGRSSSGRSRRISSGMVPALFARRFREIDARVFLVDLPAHLGGYGFA